MAIRRSGITRSPLRERHSYPGVRKRRRESRRALRVARLSRLAAPFLLLALLGELAAGLLTSPWLAVKRIRIQGVASLTAEEASQTAEAARIPEGVNLFRADPAALEGRLARLPWLSGAEVRKGLPDTLNVTLFPRPIAALLKTPNEVWEIDESGMPIRRARPGVRLPVIAAAPAHPVEAGVTLADDGIAGALAIVRLRSRLDPAPLAQIRVDESTELCLNMHDGIEVRLGPAEDLVRKLDLIRRIYEETPDVSETLSSIDVRAVDAPSCTPRDGRDSGRASADRAMTWGKQTAPDPRGRGSKSERGPGAADSRRME